MSRLNRPLYPGSSAVLVCWVCPGPWQIWAPGLSACSSAGQPYTHRAPAAAVRPAPVPSAGYGRAVLLPARAGPGTGHNRVRRHPMDQSYRTNPHRVPDPGLDLSPWTASPARPVGWSCAHNPSSAVAAMGHARRRVRPRRRHGRHALWGLAFVLLRLVSALGREQKRPNRWPRRCMRVGLRLPARWHPAGTCGTALLLRSRVTMETILFARPAIRRHPRLIAIGRRLSKRAWPT